MIPLRRRLARGAGIPFDRLTAIALILAAVLPAAALGMLVYSQVERALADDAVARTERAVDAATMHLQQEQGDLDALAGGYARWPVFQRMVAGRQWAAVDDDVLEFLVEQGAVAAGRVDVVGGTGDGAAVGEPLVTAALATVPSATVSPASASPVTPGAARVVPIGDAVYLVTSEPIADPATGQAIGRITLARRIDAVFSAELATLTGYAVTMAGPDGTADVATDAATADAALAATANASGVVRDGDIVATRTHLDGPGGGADLVLSSRVSAMQTTAGDLPLLILGLLVATAVFALLLAASLARILRRRLGVVHEGLAAIADGRVPPARRASRDDDIARVAAGLDRLVATLDRREDVLRRSLAAAAAVPIHLTAAEAARALAGTTADVFGLAWVRVVEPDGAVLASSGDPVGQAEGAPPMGPESDGEAGAAAGRHARPRGATSPADLASIEAPAGLGADGRRLEAGLQPGASWTDGDQASFEVMALLAGSVVSEAEQYGVAASRAARLDRLNRLQREFLRGVSHNLRAPLATIELAASDILDGDVDGYVRLRAEAVLVEERRLARLVSQVLLLSRMESGTLELEGEPVALAPLARRMAAELGLAGRVTLDEHAGGAVAITDQAATEQIVWILLDNAARYAPTGPIRVEVRPGPATSQPTIVLAVEDEGPGIAPGDERRIFRRFVRGRSSNGTEGTGVGLSVARGLARALGGDVAHHRGSPGARFDVLLPSSGPALEAEQGPEALRRA